MKICAISDTHGRDGWLLPSCDLFIHCGDITAGGSLEETRKFADALNLRTDITHKIIVPGNHDRCFEQQRLEVETLFDNSTHILINDDLSIKHDSRIYTLFGSAYTPTFMNWHFMGHEDELAVKYRSMPRELDVLITHGPKLGTLDRLGARWDYERVGSTALKHAIQGRDIKHHFFGHIHNEGGMSVVTGDGITSHNVAACDDAYNLVRGCKVVEL